MTEELQPQNPAAQAEEVQPTAVDIAVQARATALEASAKPGLIVHEGGDQWRELPDSVSTTENGAVEIRDDAKIGDNTVLDTAPDPKTTIARTGENGPLGKINIVEETPAGTYAADYRLGSPIQGSGTISNPRKVGSVKVTRGEGQYQHEIKSPQNREKAGAIIAKMALKDATQALEKTPAQVAEDRKLAA